MFYRKAPTKNSIFHGKIYGFRFHFSQQNQSIWVNFITTSLFSRSLEIMVFIWEIIPLLWPQDSGQWNMIIYPDISPYIPIFHGKIYGFHGKIPLNQSIERGQIDPFICEAWPWGAETACSACSQKGQAERAREGRGLGMGQKSKDSRRETKGKTDGTQETGSIKKTVSNGHVEGIWNLIFSYKHQTFQTFE